MTSINGRKRLIALFGLQIVFALAVTLAALAFLAASSANGGYKASSLNSNKGMVFITQMTFKPNKLSSSDYND